MPNAPQEGAVPGAGDRGDSAPRTGGARCPLPGARCSVLVSVGIWLRGSAMPGALLTVPCAALCLRASVPLCNSASGHLCLCASVPLCRCALVPLLCFAMLCLLLNRCLCNVIAWLVDFGSTVFGGLVCL